MVELYSKKVYEISKGAQADDLEGSISYLNAKEKEVQVNGKTLVELLNMELVDLYDFISGIKDEVAFEIVSKMKKDIENLLCCDYLEYSNSIGTSCHFPYFVKANYALMPLLKAKANFAPLPLLFPQNLCKQIFCGTPVFLIA